MFKERLNSESNSMLIFRFRQTNTNCQIVINSFKRKADRKIKKTNTCSKCYHHKSKYKLKQKGSMYRGVEQYNNVT